MTNTKRILAIIGASVLMLGFFLPVVSFLGFASFSYFDLLTKISTRFMTGLVILALGGLSLFLALKNNFKPLTGTGILALAVLAFDFVTYKKYVASYSPLGQIGISADSVPAPFGQYVEDFVGFVIQPSWGMIILAMGGILLIIAGALTDKPHLNNPDWNRNPPPPMNYT